MASVDMCEHDWPGTGCKECILEAHDRKISSLEDRFLDEVENRMFAEARVYELEEKLKESEKLAWEHFYIHQEVFNYLLSKGYVDSVVEGDNWEAAAQNIINAIKNVENER